MRKYLFVLILSFNPFHLGAQDLNGADSLQTKNSFIKSAILPLTLISAGIIANNSHFEKDLRYDIRAQTGENFEFKIDDYLLVVPVIEMYLADALHVEAKNHWFDQTKYLVISNAIASAVTFSLKGIVSKSRPDGSDNDSFPSGHTTTSFVNASVLMHEFKDSAPILAYSGYLFSTTTGVFRMVNDKHWISDVLVGAGIGILATELVYFLEPFKNFNPFKNHKNMNLVPLMDQSSYGFYFSYRF